MKLVVDNDNTNELSMYFRFAIKIITYDPVTEMDVTLFDTNWATKEQADICYSHVIESEGRYMMWIEAAPHFSDEQEILLSNDIVEAVFNRFTTAN